MSDEDRGGGDVRRSAAARRVAQGMWPSLLSSVAPMAAAPTTVPTPSPPSTRACARSATCPSESTALVVVPGHEARQAGARRGPGRRRQDRARQGAVALPRAARSCACSATRASTRPRRCTSGTTASSCCASRPRPTGTGWQEVQDDIFGEEFLLERPLMTAIASPEPVVLLIDEIDKTDQEFEAMLLEVLSDFQISIPELGRVEARTQPGRAADLEQHARADRGAQAPLPVPVARLPRAEHELEIVRLHAPELDEQRRRASSSRSSRWSATSTSRSRRRSRSRSTGRARCCCSARRTSTTQTFRDTMSVIVKHRTDLDVVAERVGVKLRRPLGCLARRRGFAASVVELGEELRAEGVQVGTTALLDAFAALERGRLDRPRPASARRWPRRWPSRPRTGGSSSSSSTASSSAPPRPPRCARACASRTTRAARAPPRRRPASEEFDLDALRQQIAAALRDGSEGAMRDLARLAIAAFGRQGEGSGVIGVDVQRIRRALGLRAEPQPDLPPGRPAPRRACRATSCAASSSSCAASSSAARSSARRRCRPSARSTSSTARCRPARCRTSRPCTASSPSSSAG